MKVGAVSSPKKMIARLRAIAEAQHIDLEIGQTPDFDPRVPVPRTSAPSSVA